MNTQPAYIARVRVYPGYRDPLLAEARLAAIRDTDIVWDIGPNDEMEAELLDWELENPIPTAQPKVSADEIGAHAAILHGNLCATQCRLPVNGSWFDLARVQLESGEPLCQHGLREGATCWRCEENL